MSDWWLCGHRGVVIRVMKPDPATGELVETAKLKAEGEQLQQVWDKAAREFHDPSRQPTRPFPDHLLLKSDSPLRSSPPTSAPIGRSRRKR